MKKVDFFIAGAPKSGTSSLFNYLSQHPDVFMPDEKMKEPNFFNTDHTGPKYFNSEEEYNELFKNAGNRLIGEASPFYLYSKEAPSKIKKYNPSARFIFIFRNPVDMLYSLHGQYLIDGNTETIRNFLDALNAEDDRKKGERIPRYCNRPEGLLYSNHVKYKEHLQNYLDVFPESQIKVILFEDFIDNTKKIFSEILSFLDLADFNPVIKKINAHEEPKIKLLHKTSVYLKHSKLGGKIRKNIRLNTGVFKKLEQLNRIESKRKPLAKDDYNMLVQRFEDDVLNFQDFICRNLDSWLKRL